ncbi:hypothetical protein N8T08_010944 [Aspergillus melleus]|uniref:Uncharacterized protein n=1 Tax=Aspergillus melleus TaxID=138277 RepID=A0ACC3AQP1_9EURO|nr:hypothetical protein N8T08_010944 [Aspergillus melleus]
MPPGNDEDYFLPVEDQRVFGAGISRKRVNFVRSSDHELNTTRTSSAPAPSTQTGPSIANKYLSIVLSKSQSSGSTTPDTSTPPPSTFDPNATQSAPPSPSASSQPHDAPAARCEVCQLPLAENADGSSGATENRPHEASLAHQVCLTHSHPPSHLDRSRHGLRYLSAYGWDPDGRRGLGAPGREGILEPLKGRLKVDTVGLGAEGDPEESGKKPKTNSRAPVAKVEKLNAKQVRKGHADAKKRGDRLREMFYQNDDVQKYLSGGE